MNSLWPSNEQLDGFKAVLLDLDNTLYDYLPCHIYALDQVYAEIVKMIPGSREEFEQKYRAAGQAVKARLPGVAASHSRLLYFKQMLETEFGRTMAAEALSLEETYWNHFLTKAVVKPEALEFIDRARTLGCKICLATDLTAQIQLTKVSRWKLSDRIDLVVSSEEAGAEKPEPAIFRLALEKLQLAAKEVIMIGDDPVKDGAGAEGLGIKTFII